MGKRSFIVYTDNIECFDEMTDEQLGKLYRAQLQYANGMMPEIEDPFVRFAFKMMKGQMDGQHDRQTAEYKGFRRAVLERDHYTCQLCGAANKLLHVHHIKRFSLFPGLRTNVDNGITLCRDCHREVHRNER